MLALIIVASGLLLLAGGGLHGRPNRSTISDPECAETEAVNSEFDRSADAKERY